MYKVIARFGFNDIIVSKHSTEEAAEQYIQRRQILSKPYTLIVRGPSET